MSERHFSSMSIDEAVEELLEETAASTLPEQVRDMVRSRLYELLSQAVVMSVSEVIPITLLRRFLHFSVSKQDQVRSVEQFICKVPELEARASAALEECRRSLFSEISGGIGLMIEKGLL
ncbi:MAG: hypothetical protein K1X83_01930 [Oligoflexia bacterium]|nr:hypothetical protein [Oligoflexia bacterium]